MLHEQLSLCYPFSKLYLVFPHFDDEPVLRIVVEFRLNQRVKSFQDLAAQVDLYLSVLVGILDADFSDVSVRLRCPRFLLFPPRTLLWGSYLQMSRTPTGGLRLPRRDVSPLAPVVVPLGTAQDFSTFPISRRKS